MKRFFSSLPPAGVSFHKRPLPKTLIPFSSTEGRQIFQEALASRGLENYFPLAEQFLTQSEPQYCSLSSLAMVLNALNYDPKKIWKNPWRWVTEETLQCESRSICGHSLEKVVENGLDFSEFESLARCHGVNIYSKRAHSHHHHSNESSTTRHDACDGGLSKFRALISEVCSNDKADTFIVVNYSRKILGQTGDGHFSPIGGYHATRDLVLILDVARFKYPPYWVNLQDLWTSMSVSDKKTSKSRGYFVVSTWKDILDETTIVTNNINVPIHAEPRANQSIACPPLIRTWLNANADQRDPAYSHNCEEHQ